MQGMEELKEKRVKIKSLHQNSGYTEKGRAGEKGNPPQSPFKKGEVLVGCALKKGKHWLGVPWKREEVIFCPPLLEGG